MLSASIDASFRLVPHESPFFSRGWRSSSLGVVPCQATTKASTPQAPWCVLYLWLQKGIRENMAWPEAIEFYALSCGSSRKPAGSVLGSSQSSNQNDPFRCPGSISCPFERPSCTIKLFFERVSCTLTLPGMTAAIIPGHYHRFYGMDASHMPFYQRLTRGLCFFVKNSG